MDPIKRDSFFKAGSRTRWPVSRVLSSCMCMQDGQPFLCDRYCYRPDATHPERELETAPARPLLGLAPGGVYPAGNIAAAPVGSYPTLSPLPGMLPSTAVYSLWHFPSARAGWTLSTALFPWSPDFPPAVTRQRLPGHLVRPSYTVLQAVQDVAASADRQAH